MHHLCIVCWCFNCTWYTSSQSTKHQFAPEMCIMRTSCCALLFVLTWHFSSKVSQACCEPPPTTPTRPPTGAIGQSNKMKQNLLNWKNHLTSHFIHDAIISMYNHLAHTKLPPPAWQLLRRQECLCHVVSKCYSGHFLVFYLAHILCVASVCIVMLQSHAKNYMR